MSLPQAPRAPLTPRATDRGPGSPRVLMSTEGTYPFIMGGVSTWCDVLLHGLPGVQWQLLPITAGGLHRVPRFSLPDNARVVDHLDLWSEAVHPWNPLRRARHDRTDLPGELVRGLLAWDGDLDALLDALVWCRANSSRVRLVFRSRAGWQSYLDALEEVLDREHSDTTSPPDIDVLQTSELFQSLYWVARCAALPTPTGADAPDVLHVTAAGWAGIPLVVHRAVHGTPLVATEHGVYVREAYLHAIRNAPTAAAQWVAGRLARGLTRLTYANADVLAPVTHANAVWERALGVDDARIRTIHNGVLVPTEVEPLPHRKRVITIGRIDPLKDLKTMLHTAATVLEQMPDALFVHFGPVPEENARYHAEVRALHAELGLGGRFRFAGPTDDPFAQVAQADVFLLSSISEGFPMTVLEAMAAGRPIVSTAVGGVPEAMAGCGFTAPPGDHEALAAGVLALLGDTSLTEALGRRARARVIHHFGQAACLEAYRELFAELSGLDVAPVRELPGAEAYVATVGEPSWVSDWVGDHLADPHEAVARPAPPLGSRTGDQRTGERS